MSDQGNTAPALRLRDVRHCWPGGTPLMMPALELAQGETVLLLGPSGSGKSTLLSLICGTLAPDAGHIWVSGQEMTALPPGQRDSLRAEQIGVIFQQFNLLPFGTVSDNIALPLRFAPGRRARAASGEAEALCTALGLPQGVMRRAAGTLSVGQQQRVAAARALIGAPALVVADEPTSALDADAQARFMDLLFAQLARTGAGLLMVSHDARLAAPFDRVLHLNRLTAEGA